ncbi:hypothetical protein AX774_g5164 [Zancudomyces culisetae]|uniref:Uncharacterized protein n=1 Tax=Zancudomyces culisetae TaxID=1213189 RepID=A0A1R1PK77_ZANCU|nr:hypothetical protein AX774_g5164 [Zancudomyces culisetae]|eukprot:OMH81381.1 hypothetical protein AX774_g5164 [Zancudomyces culisetae]
MRIFHEKGCADQQWPAESMKKGKMKMKMSVELSCMQRDGGNRNLSYSTYTRCRLLGLRYHPERTQNNKKGIKHLVCTRERRLTPGFTCYHPL